MSAFLSQFKIETDGNVSIDELLVELNEANLLDCADMSPVWI